MAWQHIGSLALSAPKCETPTDREMCLSYATGEAQRLFALELAIYLALLKLDAH
jgi:hypothetical protein